MLKQFRKIQMILSSLLFIGIFSFFYATTNFKITHIQLSYWGVDNPYAWLWNSLLVLLSFSMLFNIYSYLDAHPRLQFRTVYKCIFFGVCFSLFLTGMLPMNHPWHYTVAWAYFFSFPIGIMSLAYFNSQNFLIREWRMHLIASASLVIVPSICVFIFKGMAMGEITHSSLILLWNLYLLKNH